MPVELPVSEVNRNRQTIIRFLPDQFAARSSGRILRERASAQRVSSRERACVQELCFARADLRGCMPCFLRS